MNPEHRRDATPARRRRGLARALLTALLDGADEALGRARERERRMAEDDQCRLRPAHSRLARGYEEL